MIYLAPQTRFSWHKYLSPQKGQGCSKAFWGPVFVWNHHWNRLPPIPYLTVSVEQKSGGLDWVSVLRPGRLPVWRHQELWHFLSASGGWQKSVPFCRQTELLASSLSVSGSPFPGFRGPQTLCSYSLHLQTTSDRLSPSHPSNRSCLFLWSISLTSEALI